MTIHFENINTENINENNWNLNENQDNLSNGEFLVEKEKLSNKTLWDLKELKTDFNSYIASLETPKLQEAWIVDFFEKRLLQKEEKIS